MTYYGLSLDISPPVARIRLTRALDAGVLQALDSACEAVGNEEGVVVTLIEAEAPVFADGEASADSFACLDALACPLLIALQGEASGAGLALALACDLRVAEADTRFNLAGVDPAALGRVVGAKRVDGLLKAGEIDAAAALKAGLVSRVFPPAKLASEAEALAAMIGSRGPIALRFIKEAVRNGLTMSIDQALLYELDLSVILQTTADRAEGVRAFFEKRPPRFTGR